MFCATLSWKTKTLSCSTGRWKFIHCLDRNAIVAYLFWPSAWWQHAKFNDFTCTHLYTCTGLNDILTITSKHRYICYTKQTWTPSLSTVSKDHNILKLRILRGKFRFKAHLRQSLITKAGINNCPWVILKDRVRILNKSIKPVTNRASFASLPQQKLLYSMLKHCCGLHVTGLYTS